MPETIKTKPEVISEETLPGLSPADRRDSSAPAGIFFLRRARYFNQAPAKSGPKSEKSDQGVRGAEIAETTGSRHRLPGP